MEIVEFGDYSCPSCARVFETLERLKSELKDDGVKVEFKNLPLTEIHPDAQVAAEAAECARLQGKFEAMQRLLFENHASLNAERIVSLAGEAGLDVDRFRKDMTAGKGLKRIEQDMSEAQAKGISFTPCLFIDGEMLQVDATYDTLKSLISEKTRHH